MGSLSRIGYSFYHTFIMMFLMMSAPWPGVALVYGLAIVAFFVEVFVDLVIARPLFGYKLTQRDPLIMPFVIWFGYEVPMYVLLGGEAPGLTPWSGTPSNQLRTR